NLLRGAGSAGLASMPALSGTTIRPLIDTNRQEIEAYLAEQNQDWQTDASNFDLGFARNRLRHVVIPQLASEFNPNLIETLSRTVEILEGEDAWMRALSEEWLTRNGTKRQDQFVIEVGPLQAAPVAMVRRVLRTALQQAGSALCDVSFDQIESMRALLSGGKSRKVGGSPGGMETAREFDSLVVRWKVPAPKDYEYKLKIPGSVHIPELSKLFIAEILGNEGRGEAGHRVFVDGDSIGPYVRIRNWKPGDYYRPVGLPAGKLKKLFQRARIPRRDPASCPGVVSRSVISLVASF